MELTEPNRTRLQRASDPERAATCWCLQHGPVRTRETQDRARTRWQAMQRVDCSGSSQPSSVCLLLWVPVCRWEDFFFVTTRTGSDQVYRYPNDACIAVAGDNGSLWLGVERPDRAAGPTLRQTVADGAATATLSNGALGIARFLGEASRPDSSWPCGKTVKCHQEVRTAQRNGSGMFSFAGVEVSKPGFERLDRLWRTIEERKAEGDWEGGSEAPRRNLVSPVSGAGPGCRSLLDRRFRADAHMRRVLTPFCALKRTARLLAKGPDKCAQKAPPLSPPAESASL